jgi:hypothetical protein
VNERYIPIPLRIGGSCKPIALLENKTEIESRYFKAKNPYFGIKLM